MSEARGASIPNDHIRSWRARSEDEVCVCAIGATSPLGSNPAAAAAAYRASISVIGDHPHFVDKLGQAIAIACDPELNINMGLCARLENMLLTAVDSAIGTELRGPAIDELRVLIGIPEARPGLPHTLRERLSLVVSEATNVRQNWVQILQYGHAAGLMAIQLAAERIAGGAAELYLAGGVDSYLDAETLEWLDDCGMLMSGANRDGFPPGEGAGICLLASRASADRYGLPVLASVLSAATSLEINSILSSGLCIGEGLTETLRSAVSGIPPRHLVTSIYCDINGQRYRNEEFVYTLLRTQKLFVNAHDYECPAECWGDVGAASGPLHLCLAIAANQRGYSKGAYPVAWAGSLSGHRSAVLLSLQKAESVRE